MPTKTYLLLCPSLRLVKIGKSINPIRRMQDIQLMNAADLEPLLVFQVAEAWLHAKFHEYRHRGEWFIVSMAIIDYLDSIDEHDSANRLRRVLRLPKKDHNVT